ncbi:hypothetical protein DSLASN_17320 [Desulfoluna limicola]|uniref:Uncharacterized protein n=1 Tax=Desulfoluna limicola TaxID=2810562 RepID=A0ABN6F3E7_9BACT|nr:hypothetical protein DSLASN_17320 [Desulfoluna limicola]
MFKALIVQKDPAAAIGNDKIHMDKSHSFVRLADQAGVKLSIGKNSQASSVSKYNVPEERGCDAFATCFRGGSPRRRRQLF